MPKATSAKPGTSRAASAVPASDCSGIVGAPAGCKGVELVLPVQHPEQPAVALSLVVCRSAGRLPWYLLTNEALSSEDEAWRVVFAYVRRWNIEIVQTQMTKTNVFTPGRGGDHITDLHLLFGH